MISPTEAAIKFTLSWETSQAVQEMRNLASSFDQITNYQKVVGDAFGDLKTEAEDNLKAIQDSLISVARQYQERAAEMIGLRKQGPLKEDYIDLAKQLGVGPGSSMEDIKALSELAHEQNEKVIKDLKEMLKVEKDMSTAGAAVWDQMLNVGNAVEGVNGKLKNTNKETKSWLDSTKELYEEIKKLTIASSPVVAAGLVDKDISDLRKLRGQAGFTDEQIRALGSTIISQITSDLGGIVSTSELKPLITQAGQRGFKYDEIPEMMKKSVLTSQALDISREESLTLLDKMIHKMGIASKETEKMVGQMQFFARETQTATSEMDNLVSSAEDYILQLDKGARGEGVKQVAALGASLQNIGMPISQVMGMMNKLQEGFTDPSAVMQTGFIEGLAGVDHGSIAKLAQQGRIAEAFDIIQKGLMTAKKSSDKTGVLQIRRFMEQNLGVSGTMFDRFGQGNMDIQGLLHKSEGVDKPLLPANVGSAHLFERFGNIAGAAFKDFGRTFQRMYEVPVHAAYEVTNKLFHLWRSAPEALRDVTNAVVGIGLIISGFMGKSLLLGKLKSTFSGILSVVRGLSTVAPAAAEGVAAVTEAGAAALPVAEGLFATGGALSLGVIGPIALAIAVVAANIYAVYKWLSKFNELGGGADLAKMFKSDGIVDFAQNLDKVIRKLDDAGSWFKWIVAFIPTVFMKVWEGAFNKDLLASLQRVEDVLVGLGLRIGRVLTPIIDEFKAVINVIGSLVKSVAVHIKSMLQEVWDDIKTGFMTVFKWLGDHFEPFKALGNFVSKEVSGFLNAFADMFKGLEEEGKAHREGKPYNPAVAAPQAPRAPVATPPVHAVAPVASPTHTLPLPASPPHHEVMAVASGKLGVKYEELILEAAKKFSVDPALVAAIIKQESRFNTMATSGKGARGLMQMMPDTARKDFGINDPNQLYDPRTNIFAGTEYISRLLKSTGGNVDLAIAAYNGGIGNVRKYNGMDPRSESPIPEGHNAIPPFKETQDYVRIVSGNYEQFSRSIKQGSVDVVAAVNQQTERMVAQLRSLEKTMKDHPPGYRDVSGGVSNHTADTISHLASYN